jgi:hypothetical protein
LKFLIEPSTHLLSTKSLVNLTLMEPISESIVCLARTSFHVN